MRHPKQGRVIPNPRTTSHDTQQAVAPFNWSAIVFRPVVMTPIAILHPLISVAEHVIEPEPIRLERTHRKSARVGAPAPGSAIERIAITCRTTQTWISSISIVRVAQLSVAPRRVFPLRFARQAIPIGTTR